MNTSCVVCEKTLVNVTARRKYCSERCNNAARAIPGLRNKRVEPEANKCCEVCSQTFPRPPDMPTTQWKERRTCSDSCWRALMIQTRKKRQARNPRDQRLDIVCLWCQAVFKCKRDRLKNGGGKYCSKQCHDEARLKKTVLECSHCQLLFLCDNAKLGWRKYCSEKCKREAEYAQVSRQCLVCGKDFAVYKSTLAPRGHDKGLYCSQACSAQGLSGANCYMWKGGISFAPYPVAWTGQVKREIKNRDNHKCAFCGKADGTTKRKHGIHHIDYNKSNLIRSNLLTLCSACHGRTNHDREHWRGVLHSLMESQGLL